MSEPGYTTPLERAVWQIERGIQWQRNVTSEGGIQVTVRTLQDILKAAAAETGDSTALKGFKPGTLDDVLDKARELRAAEVVSAEK